MMSQSDGQHRSDVASGAFYADAVKWAVENGVASGVSAGSFDPNTPCTRAQAVTFLWRAVGAPVSEDAVNKFKDVSENSPYYKAILWASENGITSGTSADSFSPDAIVNRGQAMTFLYKALGSPEAAGSASFKDVAAGAYYEKAVAWASGAKVTSGTGADTFGPADPCNRAQIVTFLYNAFK